MKNLPDIVYEKSKITPIVDARTSFYKIPFYKDSEYFSNLDSYVGFIKGVERMVRSNDKYTKYIAYLKNEIKLNNCQVLKNVTDDDFKDGKTGIEMHHGPIFTLYDVCAIVTEYFLMKRWKITTMRIADAVLNEHMANRVQVVMLSESMHQLVHERGIFINIKQAWGNINEFIDKYRNAMSPEMIEKFNRYVDRSMLMDSTDFNILRLNDKLFQKPEE